MNFTREDLIASIKKIDENPQLKTKRASSTYDLIYNEKKYPPILLLSVANQLNNGKELLLNDFNNDVKEPFKILRDNGFEIKKKQTSYYDQLVQFLQQAKTTNLKFSTFAKSFLDLKVKVSFGQGVPARIPWISFLRDGISTNNGIYPVYLYYKDENLLVLAYGVSEENKFEFKWPIEDVETIEYYFKKNNLKAPFRYGKSFIYKVYDVNNMPEMDIVDSDLVELLNFYKSIDLQNNMNGPQKDSIKFDINLFNENISEAGLIFSEKLISRFVASLLTKPFVLLTGLSGSGKTKIAQSFVKWICEDESQFKIIPVGADWTNREPLLGYQNGLNLNEYIAPDSGVLKLILEASKLENAEKPYFLILDEMNLSHVERYFADFLSVMESDDRINLYSGTIRKDLDGNDIPTEIFWSKNLFIIGTVNIDETTYMFSPKVLDRANTIEFRVDESDIKTFFEMPSKINLSVLESKGTSMAKTFLKIAADHAIEKDDEYTDVLLKFFNELKKVGAEFGYRTAVEMLLLIKKLNVVSSIPKNEIIDIAIMQKLLPKLHGSRSKISKVLDALILLCLKEGETFSITKSEEVLPENIKYPISFEKLVRMYKNALDNGFTSYAEA